MGIDPLETKLRNATRHYYFKWIETNDNSSIKWVLMAALRKVIPGADPSSIQSVRYAGWIQDELKYLLQLPYETVHLLMISEGVGNEG